MSECVVRMEMPENCCECQLRQEDYEMGEEFCPFTGVECLSIGRQNNCPIICSFTGEEESQSPKPTDPVPIRDVYYVMTECDAKTGTVKYEPRERIEL